jgi:hypothetical protein
VNEVEPVTRFPNDRTAQLWRQRVEPPLVTVRCARGAKRCDRLAQVYDTPGGSVVVFYQHTPDRPVALDLPNGLPEGYEPPATFKKFDPENRRALIRGRKDERGTAVSLEDDDYWSNVVAVGCRHHLELVELTRAELMTTVREARATGRTVELKVSRN